MWESIKNDPILKTVVVIVLGVLAFGFAFNVMFGSGGSGMEHGMAGGGTLLNSSLANALSILIKILLIVLTIAAITVVIKQLKKYLSGASDEKMLDTIKKYIANKWVASTVGLLVILLIVYLISGTGSPYYGNNMIAGNTYYPMQGPNYNTGVSGILAGLVNILLIVSVIGLTAGLIMYFKAEYLNNVVSPGKVKEQTKCSICGRELKTEWKCCPACGSEQVSTVTQIEKKKDSTVTAIENTQENQQ